MTFVRKFNGKAANSNQEPMVACYTCPVDGEFDCEVRRDENGEAPDVIPCPLIEPGSEDEGLRCGMPATWTPSASVGCRVRRIEVVRGKWEPPERKTYLDTRKLGEGQSMDEFKAERKKLWTERRMQTVKELLR